MASDALSDGLPRNPAVYRLQQRRWLDSLTPLEAQPEPQNIADLKERNEPYSELGADYFLERRQKNAYQRRPVHQLERMGYDVKLESKSAA
jgi:hypothetical protein